MCKVLILTDASKISTLRDTAEVVAAELTKTETDGFGYAVQGATNVFGEKCVDASFTSHFVKNLVNLPIVKRLQTTFGSFESPKGPAIFHGRTSTNQRGLLNCHPIQRDGWNLIHNGVVGDHGPKYEKFTTNDSEDLLHRLITGGIRDVETHLTGYYAFAAIDPSGRLHIAKDGIASLHVAWDSRYETYIFATSKESILSVGKSLKMELSPTATVEDNVYSIFQGNNLLHQETIHPRGWDREQASHARSSLGYDIQDWSDESAWEKYEKAKTLERREDAYYCWLEEVQDIDDTYIIESQYGRQIRAKEFHALDDHEKERCTIFREDGTELLHWETMLDDGASA